jgi:hypothetical protein
VNAKAITTYMGHASIRTTYDLHGTLMPVELRTLVATVLVVLNPLPRRVPLIGPANGAEPAALGRDGERVAREFGVGQRPHRDESMRPRQAWE